MGGYKVNIAELGRLIQTLEDGAEQVRDANKTLAAVGQLEMLGNETLKGEAHRFEEKWESGPSMVAQRAGEHRISPEAAGQLQEVVIPEFKAEFQILAPDAAHLVVMVITTTSEIGWPAVAAEAMRVANSVRFEYPDDSRLDASEY
ncbi:hypothetical protein [Amycolatopsis palatopharyngis]|uniref:hypothetical protein n=1 Tax=Amycolatopsis palatopharyngis TaxID=187982 RepID=UPI000E274838|nr:hypothetical protein [Amycolatopsis palatopharyngis]